MNPILVLTGILIFSLQSYARPKPNPTNQPPAVRMQIGYSDSNNLLKVAVTSTGSFDPDGTIIKTEISLGDGSAKKIYDGKFVKNDSVLNHTYAKVGKYTVTMAHTDNKGLVRSASKIVEVIQVGTLVKVGVTFGPKKYRASNNTYVETINRSAEQAKDFYKVTFKNGDGKEYKEEDCRKFSFYERLKCLIRNAQSIVYKNAIRAKSISLVINNENIVREDEFNLDTDQLIKYVRLSQTNQLRLRVKGNALASVGMLVEQMTVPVVDTTAPVLTSNVESNTVTTFNKIHISISDQSAVTTQIFKSGVLITTQQTKEFDIPLTEGANSFVLKSVDSSQNKAADLVLSNIVLDTTAPVLAASVNSNSITNNSLVRITITDQSTVSTQIYKNGTLLKTETSKAFDLVLSEGLNSFTLKSTDAATNAAADFILTNITLDTVVPKLSSNVSSGTLTSVKTARITVADQSAVSTQIFKSGTLVKTENAKSFDLALTEGVNSFVLKSTDAAQNKAADFVLSNIVVDSTAPVLSSSVSSNALTNNNKVRITITDTSAAVTTQIFRNGVLQSTQTTKSFDLILSEGINSFILKAVDQAQNKAVDFVLSNITLDSIVPKIASNVASGATVTDNKVHINITDFSEVITQVFKNGVLQSTQSSKTFDLVLTAGSNSFILKSVDAAQNKANDFTLSNITLQAGDITAPQLMANVSSNTTTKNRKISVVITDQSSVTTQVYRNNILIATEQSKSFDLTLEEGVNSFILKSTDTFQNKAADFLLSSIVLDTTAPIIASNLNSNSLTNNLIVHITINDQTSTTTQVSNNGTAMFSTQSMSFDITLIEGQSTYSIVSTDLAGNISTSNFTYTLDSVRPSLSSNLKSQYIFDTLPQLVTITMRFDEPVQSVTFNNAAAIQIGPFDYSYTLQLDQAGSKTYMFKAIDLAGNELIVQQNVTVLLDQVAPVITTNVIPPVISTNEFDLTVTITENSGVTTELYVDDLLQLTTSEKLFTYKVIFDQNQQVQSKKINIISKDNAQNQSNTVLTIVKDISPLLVQIISPQNQSILSSPIVEVRARANKPLAVAKINGQIVQISSDQLSVKSLLQKAGDGKFTIRVEVTDVSGAQSSHEVQAEVKSNSLPSWVYEECRAE